MICSGRTHIYYYNTFVVQAKLQEDELKKLKYDLQWQNIFTITTEV
jgi:hypothetical protein